MPAEKKDSLFDALKSLFSRRKREEEWAARFTNTPARRDNKLPLDPGKSELS